MNRKGIAYTMVAVILMMVVATIFFTQQRVSFNDMQNAQRDRVLSVNDFIANLESDSQRAAYIAGFRTLISLEQQVTSTGQYIDDVDEAFKEIFLTGNLSGGSFEVMRNSSFNEYLTRVQYEMGKQGVVFNATVIELKTWQTDPWYVIVNITIELNVTDVRGSARWETERVFVGVIPLEDIRDPIFTKETLGRVQRVIRQTNITEFVDDSGNKNDTSGISWHFNNSRYLAAGRGPTLLMRFEGNLSDHEHGVESIIDTSEYDDQGITTFSNRNVVDYEYYKGTLATVCNIQNLTETIRFDDESAVIYEVEGELEYSSC